MTTEFVRFTQVIVKFKPCVLNLRTSTVLWVNWLVLYVGSDEKQPVPPERVRPTA